MSKTYTLTVRYVPGFYGTQKLADGLTEEQALVLAENEARKFRCRCCLTSPQGKNIWIAADGSVEGSDHGDGPRMEIGGQQFKVSVDSDD